MPGQCSNSVVMDTQYVGLTDAVERQVLVKVSKQCADSYRGWFVKYGWVECDDLHLFVKSVCVMLLMLVLCDVGFA